MKLFRRIVLALFLTFLATFAVAQANLYPYVQHVIIVIQENRTPTNLFHEDATLVANGAHVMPTNNQATCGTTPPPPYSGGPSCTDKEAASPVVLTGVSLAPPFDPNHAHYPGWYCTYDGGKMDGACHIPVSEVTGGDISGCPGGQLQHCPYTFVCNSGSSCPTAGELDPYFNIANQFGFANWMFQTHQGESQDAHLFLFAGTSAPTAPTDDTDYCSDAQNGIDYYCYQWFAAENATNVTRKYGAGCTAESGTLALDLPPASPDYPEPKEYHEYNSGYPCYSPNSLPQLLNSAQPNPITWRYYAANDGLAFWNAPNMISYICNESGGSCNYPSNVIVGNPAQVLQDLGAAAGQPCDLQQVTWVVPDGSWSDHPGLGSFDAGPSWVAAIVNALGGYTNFNSPLPNKCYDTVGGQQIPYWQDTVVLVVWDDWGGFYDDILPWQCNANGVCNGYPNQSESGDYVYGFRVPLLVVGAYAGTYSSVTGWSGYISGACPGGNCEGQEKPPYVHDFGSILNFIEYALGTGGNPLGYPGGISPNYFYADWLAPDAPLACGSKTLCPYGLSDFFSFGSPPRTFSLIQGAKYDTSCFLGPATTHCFGTNWSPSDPDDDFIDAQ